MKKTALDIDQLPRPQVDALRRVLEAPKYEVIPLKNVIEQSGYLPDGATVSVTASPAKGMKATIDLAVELQANGFDVIPHLSARLTKDRAELEGLLKQIDEAGIERAFVVGGDAEPDGEFYDGLSLLTAMEEIGSGLVEIGIPGYPEGHHFVDEPAIRQAIIDKAPYASYITSQMCFSHEAIRSWVNGLRSDGVGLGVYIGTPGVAELTKLITLSMRIGVGASASFLSKNKSLAGKLVRPGGYGPDDLLIKTSDVLADPIANVLGLHVYTFNQVQTTEEWRHRMLDQLSS